MSQNPKQDTSLFDINRLTPPPKCGASQITTKRCWLWRVPAAFVPGLLGGIFAVIMLAAASAHYPVKAEASADKAVKASKAAKKKMTRGAKTAAVKKTAVNKKKLTKKQLKRKRRLKKIRMVQKAKKLAREAKRKAPSTLPSLEVRQRIFWPRVRDYARKQKLDPVLVMAIIQVESHFNPFAVSKRGAAGLMQIVPGTAEHLGLTDPFDPDANVEAGTRYLKWLFKVFKGHLKMTLAAYNAGPTRVLNKGRVPHIKETKRYIAKVIRHRELFRDRFESLAQN
jgi:soluble lytic murein transglycosylase-like protein